jgi:hypothetical protein
MDGWSMEFLRRIAKIENSLPDSIRSLSIIEKPDQRWSLLGRNSDRVQSQLDGLLWESRRPAWLLARRW